MHDGSSRRQSIIFTVLALLAAGLLFGPAAFAYFDASPRATHVAGGERAAARPVLQASPSAPGKVFLPQVHKPGPSPTPSATPTTTATPTATPTPTATSTTAPPPGIRGQVTYQGNGIGGITVRLDRCMTQGGCRLVLTTQTDTDGRYNFANAPTLAPGAESYMVQYLNGPEGGNPDDPRFLYFWYSFVISSYTNGTIADGGSFDITNIPLNTPANNATVRLPATFSWTGRSTPTFRYVWAIANAEGDELYANEPPQNLTTFMLNEATRNAAALQYGIQYQWFAYVTNLNFGNGYGGSYEARTVTFTQTGQASAGQHSDEVKHPPRPSDPRRGE